MTRDPSPVCGRCRHFGLGLANAQRALCRRFPQAVTKVADEWCGEFAPREPVAFGAAEPAPTHGTIAA